MMQDPKIRRIFKVSDTKATGVQPPDQVFVNHDFIFLFTLGGHLADNEKEYSKLMNLLKQLGEERFYILENFGATSTVKSTPFEAAIPVESNFHDFQKIVESFDPPFGFMINHFFIFGDNQSWGIYICEFPAINIIGCIPKLTEKFRKIFSIKGNGYPKLESFIKKEFNGRDDLLKKLIHNYKLS